MKRKKKKKFINLWILEGIEWKMPIGNTIVKLIFIILMYEQIMDDLSCFIFRLPVDDLIIFYFYFRFLYFFFFVSFLLSLFFIFSSVDTNLWVKSVGISENRCRETNYYYCKIHIVNINPNTDQTTYYSFFCLFFIVVDVGYFSFKTKIILSTVIFIII